ncbi:hypothetical protein DRJ16_04095, partial [Candidatus Woesearchaeota archaeon]
MDEGEGFRLNATLENIGNATAYLANITLEKRSFYQADVYSQPCGNLSAGGNCSKEFNLTVLNGTLPGDYQIRVYGNWLNPNNTYANVSRVLNVTVAENPVLEILEPNITLVIERGKEKAANLTLRNRGISELYLINLSCQEGKVCLNFSVSFSENLFNLSEGEKKRVRVNVSVPNDWEPGNYNGTILAKASNTNCYSEDRCNKSLPIYVKVFREAGVLAQPSSITVSYLPYSRKVNLSLLNNGSDPITEVNLSLMFENGDTLYQAGNGELRIEPSGYNCGTLNPGEYCNRSFYLNITSGTAAGTYKVYGKASWQNPDGSVSSTQNVTDLYIEAIYSYDYHPTSFNLTGDHNRTYTLGTLIINNTGNKYLQFNLNPENYSEWFSYSRKLPIGIDAGKSDSITIYISIPKGTDPGIYKTNLSLVGKDISETHIIENKIPVTVKVLTNTSWYLHPTYIQEVLPLKPAGSGTDFYNITVVNEGNVKLNFTIQVSTLEGSDDPSKFLVYPEPGQITTMEVDKASEGILQVEYASYVSGKYIFEIILSNTSATPQESSVTFNITVQDVEPAIYEDTLSYPAKVDVNRENITVEVNISDNDEMADVCSQDEGCAWINVTSPSGEEFVVNASIVQQYTSSSPYKYRFRASFLPTEEGSYTIKVGARDKLSSGSPDYNYSSSFTVNVLASTSLSVSSQDSIDVLGITNDTGKTIQINFSVINSGDAGAYNVSVTIDNLPAGWSASPNSFTYAKIEEGTSKEEQFSLTIPAGTLAGSYSIRIKTEWENPDYSLRSSEKWITINVNPTRILEASPNSISISVEHNHSYIIAYNLTNKGNANITSINISCVSDYCGTFNLTFFPENISVLRAGETRQINASFSIPLGYSPGVYSLTLVNSPANANLTNVSLSVQVLQDKRWIVDKTNISKLVATNSSGLLDKVKITNIGNVPLSFELNISGNITSLLDYPSSLSVEKQSSEEVYIYYNVSKEGDYSGLLNISSSGSEPEFRLINLSLGVRPLEIEILSYTEKTNASEEIEVRANLSYNKNPVENASFSVFINESSCYNLSQEYLGNGSWLITCLAPSLKDGYYYDLRVKALALVEGNEIEGSQILSKAIYYYDLSPPEIKGIVAEAKEVKNETQKVNQTVRVNVTD